MREIFLIFLSSQMELELKFQITYHHSISYLQKRRWLIEDQSIIFFAVFSCNIIVLRRMRLENSKPESQNSQTSGLLLCHGATVTDNRYLVSIYTQQHLSIKRCAEELSATYLSFLHLLQCCHACFFFAYCLVIRLLFACFGIRKQILRLRDFGLTLICFYGILVGY